MIIVMGIPGAGKTTVLTAALKAASGWRVVNWGDRMVEIAKSQGLVQSRDEMRKLPVERQAKIQEDVADSLAKEEGKWILDTHCSINTPNGYLPGLPFRLLGKLKVDHLVLIESPVENILRRRTADESRQRDAQPRALLEEQLLVNKALICSYAAFSGAPVLFVVNEDGKVDAAAQKLGQLLR